MAKKIDKKKVAKIKKPASKSAKPAKKAAAKPIKKAAAAKPAKKAAAAKPVKKTAPTKVASKAAAPAKLLKKPAGKKGAEKPVALKGKTALPSPIPEKLAKKGPKGKIAPEAPVKDGAEPEEVEEEENDEVILTDADGRPYCRVKDCDQVASVDAYCRYHYLLFWKKIQVRKKILTEGKLERYVEELTARYPDKFLEMLRKDLRSEKEFLAAIQELEIDESASDNEFEEESQTYIDEVRGMAEPGAREEEDF